MKPMGHMKVFPSKPGANNELPSRRTERTRRSDQDHGALNKIKMLASRSMWSNHQEAQGGLIPW